MMVTITRSDAAALQPTMDVPPSHSSPDADRSQAASIPHVQRRLSSFCHESTSARFATARPRCMPTVATPHAIATTESDDGLRV